MADINQLIYQTQQKPQARNLLMQALLYGQLYCLGEAESLGNSEDYTDLFITEWEDGHGHIFIPCFSNLAQMEDIVEEHEPYLCLSGRVLLELCYDTTLIINPESELEFVLSSAEITQLLHLS